MVVCVCVCAAIGCLSGQLIDPLHSPHFAAVSDRCIAENVNAADECGSSNVIFSSAGVVGISCSSQPVGGQGRCDDDTDLLVPVSTSTSSSVLRSSFPANFVDVDRMVNTLNNADKSDDRCLPSDTDPCAPSHVKQSDRAVTLVDNTGFNLAVPVSVGQSLGSCFGGGPSVDVADCNTVPAEAKLVDIVADPQFAFLPTFAVPSPAVSPVVQPTGDKVSDSGRASSSASDELACIGRLNVVSDACKMSDAAAEAGAGGCLLLTDFKLPPDDRAAATCAGAVRRTVGIIDYTDHGCREMRPQPSGRSGLENTEGVRNVADGSEASEILSTAVQTSVNITAADSNASANDSADCGGVNSGSGQQVATQQSGLSVIQHRSMTDSHHQPHNSLVNDTNKDRMEILASIERQVQLTTMVAQKPSVTMDFDLALPLEQDSGSELDEGGLRDSVKMILAKYRIRRGPVGSDRMPVSSSVKTDNVLMLDADDPPLPSDHQKDSNAARDFDISSDTSDDTLGSRVRALLLKQHQEGSSAVLSTAAGVMSQTSSGEPSTRSSQNTSLDYGSLSRELEEIQMNLESMRNSEKSSLGSRRSSVSSRCVHSPVTDDFMMPESRDVLVQQKKHSDQMDVDDRGFVSNAASALVAQHEAGTLNTESVPRGHQREMAPSSLPSINAAAKPLTALAPELDRGHSTDSVALTSMDLLLTGTDVKTVERSLRATVSLNSIATLNLASVLADSCTSLPAPTSHESVESSGSRNMLISTGGEVVDMVSSIVSHTPSVGQPAAVSYSNGDVIDLSAVHDVVRDTVSEVSSLHTDVHQSRSTSYTQLDDCRLVRAPGTSVEAAVKQLEQSLSNLNQTRHNMLSTSSSDSYHNEDELQKQSSAEATAIIQLPALSTDDYCLTETGLTHNYSDSCSLSPVSKHSLLNVMRTVQPQRTAQLDKASPAWFDLSIELQSSVACNDHSLTQSVDRSIQQAENSDRPGAEHEKENDFKIPYSVASSWHTVTFASSAQPQFTPLEQLSYEHDSSSLSGSYDGDTDQLLTDQQSHDGREEWRSCSGGVDQPQLPVDRTVSADVGVGCLDTARSTEASEVATHSATDIILLQPYQ